MHLRDFQKNGGFGNRLIYFTYHCYSFIFYFFNIDAKKPFQGCSIKSKIHFNGSLFLGTLEVSPRSGIMLGGDNIFVAGPCYEPSDIIICEFSGGKVSNGSYISNIRASCTVPMLNMTGRLSIKVSVNGGRSFDFQGGFTSGDFNILTLSLKKGR